MGREIFYISLFEVGHKRTSHSFSGTPVFKVRNMLWSRGMHVFLKLDNSHLNTTNRLRHTLRKPQLKYAYFEETTLIFKDHNANMLQKMFKVSIDVFFHNEEKKLQRRCSHHYKNCHCDQTNFSTAYMKEPRNDFSRHQHVCICDQS